MADVQVSGWEERRGKQKRGRTGACNSPGSWPGSNETSSKLEQSCSSKNTYIHLCLVSQLGLYFNPRLHNSWTIDTCASAHWILPDWPKTRVQKLWSAFWQDVTWGNGPSVSRGENCCRCNTKLMPQTSLTRGMSPLLTVIVAVIQLSTLNPPRKLSNGNCNSRSIHRQLGVSMTSNSQFNFTPCDQSINQCQMTSKGNCECFQNQRKKIIKRKIIDISKAAQNRAPMRKSLEQTPALAEGCLVWPLRVTNESVWIWTSLLFLDTSHQPKTDKNGHEVVTY